MSALSRFCEAIQEYVANIDKAPDPSVNIEYFADEIDVIFDVLLNNWLGNRDPKVKYIFEGHCCLKFAFIGQSASH